MNMLEIHASALEAVNEAHHTFLISYKKKSKKVYGFVEGKEDPNFYRSLIEALLPNDWDVDLIPAGNKSKVYAVYNAIDWKSNAKNRICFFVDQDLTSFRPDPKAIDDTNIYVTDGYSIENDIVSPALFHRLLSEVFKLDALSEEEKDHLSELFSQEFEKFKNALFPLMAQIVHWRANSSDALLNNLDLKELFSINNGRLVHLIEDKSQFLRVAANQVGAEKLSDEFLSAAEDNFKSNNNHASLVRGKYLLWFLSAFLSSVHQAAPRYCAKLKRSPKMNVTAGHSNIMIYAAPRARCPSSLRTFLERNYLSYIASAQ